VSGCAQVFILLLTVIVRLPNPITKHQARQSRIYETAGSLEPTQNE